MKIILNKCFGGFGVSKEAHELYAKKKGLTLYWYEYVFNNGSYKRTTSYSRSDRALIKDFGDVVFKPNDDFWDYCLELDESRRTDFALIEVVEELGSERASGPCSKLVVVDIPDDLDYVIDDYDGIETLHQRVQTW